MSEKMLITHCSPTLAGIKTGNLFSCKIEGRSELAKDIREVNDKLTHKGIRVVPLKYYSDRALIYVYRRDRLAEDLRHSTAEKLLHELGYDLRTPEKSIMRLIERLNDGEEFPHEVGLFLSYPPQDVEAFIDDNGRDYSIVGCWKVYSKVEEAVKIFEKYKKCTYIYSNRFDGGYSLDSLTVNSNKIKTA